MGGFDFLKKILPVAGTVASFIPGGQVWGAGLNAVGGLLGGMDASDKASGITDEERRILEQQAQHANDQYNLSQTYQKPLMDKLFEQATTFDPYGAEYLSPIHRTNAEGVARGEKQAANNEIADYAERGLSRDSSGLAASLSGIHDNAAHTVAQLDSDAVQRGVQEQWQHLTQLGGTVNGMAAGSTGAALGSAGGLGGVGAMYNSQAKDAYGAAGAAINSIPLLTKATPTPGTLTPTNPNAGNNTLGTNQAGTPPPSSIMDPWTPRDPTPALPPFLQRNAPAKPLGTGWSGRGF